MLKRSHAIDLAVLTSAGLLALAGCGRSPTPATQPVADTAADDARAAELAAKEQELSQREAALALKEKEDDLARREAEFAAQQHAAAPSSPPKKSSTVKSARTSSRSTASPTAAAPHQSSTPASMPTRVTLPTGTQLTVALSSDLSSKTAHSGDPFEGSVASDVTIEGKQAVPAGSRVTGTITDVVSGSSSIGGLPTLGLRFDRLELSDGQRIPINGELVEQGKSDTARDTAKILGGAAAGAVLGHQVKKDNRGKVIGGLLGGAIGAVAAKKTGTEVELLAGSTLTISLGAPSEVMVR